VRSIRYAYPFLLLLSLFASYLSKRQHPLQAALMPAKARCRATAHVNAAVLLCQHRSLVPLAPPWWPIFRLVQPGKLVPAKDMILASYSLRSTAIDSLIDFACWPLPASAMITAHDLTPRTFLRHYGHAARIQRSLDRS
jgi:hypothetical protein